MTGEPIPDSQTQALFLLEDAKYGLYINLDGLIDVFEYESAEDQWFNKIGPPDSNNWDSNNGSIQDEMFYTRLTDTKFY